jgi:hypothetical protein
VFQKSVYARSHLAPDGRTTCTGMSPLTICDWAWWKLFHTDSW